MDKQLLESMIGIIGEEAELENAGDYKGDDGLLYCGKCRTPKQMRRVLPLDIGERVIPCLCECQKKEHAARAEEQKRRQYEQRVAELRIGSMMDAKSRNSTFANFQKTKDNERPLTIARRYVERFDEMAAKNQGLMFYGNPGTGKTFIAACIANALIEKQVPVVVTSFVKLIGEIQNQSFDRSEEAMIQTLNRAKLLIIDDLGAERSTDYALERVYNVIDSRYRSAKPLILTTNLTLGQMQATADTRYGRIYDRIFEMCYPVEMKGESWRYAEAANRFDEMSRLFD